MARTPWAAIVAALIFILSGMLWIFRRTWQKIREERKMMREAYAYLFGADELGLRLDDESVEERLDRDGAKHDWLVESLELIREDQRRIAESLREDDAEPPEVRDLPEWEPGRYRAEREENDG